jgi:hypothetical protein
MDGGMTIRFTRNLRSLTIIEADFALTRQLPCPTAGGDKTSTIKLHALLLTVPVKL